MTADTKAVETAATELTHAMGRLVKAIDDVGDDREATQALSGDLPAALERLAGRISAAQGLAG